MLEKLMHFCFFTYLRLYWRYISYVSRGATCDPRDDFQDQQQGGQRTDYFQAHDGENGSDAQALRPAPLRFLIISKTSGTDR